MEDENERISLEIPTCLIKGDIVTYEGWLYRIVELNRVNKTGVLTKHRKLEERRRLA